MSRTIGSVSALPVFACLVFLFASRAEAFNRSIGKPGNPNFANAVYFCNGTDPQNYVRGKCTVLMECVYDKLGEAFKARLSSGTSIAALLPTMLALIGSPPLELVQLALISPHRALITCCFSIGLPTGLFRQLKPVDKQLSDSNPLEPRVRVWTVVLPSLSQKSWHNILAKLFMDFLIVGLGGVMLWRNKLVANWTMVAWRCEYTYMLFIWPFVCMLWLITTVIMLFFFSESIEIHHASFPERVYRVWELMLLPYILDPDRFLPKHYDRTELPTSEPRSGDDAMAKTITATSVSTTEMGIALSAFPTASSYRSGSGSRDESSAAPARPKLQRAETSVSYSSNSVIVKVTMRSVNGLCSWRWFEAIIEALAFGIYLYATAVLTSLVFLTADEALWNFFAMTVCLSAVRIFTILF